MTGANLEGARFKNSKLITCLFKDVKTQNTSFEYSNLADSVFEGDFGMWTRLSHNNLTDTDFSKANVEMVNFATSIYNKKTKFPKNFNPDDEGLYLLDKGSTLSKYLNDMQLQGLEFDTIDLEGAYLNSTHLEGSTFKNCLLKNIWMKNANAESIKLYNCNLAESNLRGSNFSLSTLNNVDLRNADLKGANLTWAEAQDVNLDGAIYDQYTSFRNYFDPKANGMIYKHTTEFSDGFYGMDRK